MRAVSVTLRWIATAVVAQATPIPDGESPTGYSATMILPPGATSGLAPSYYAYEIALTPSVGTPATVVQSHFKVLPA